MKRLSTIIIGFILLLTLQSCSLTTLKSSLMEMPKAQNNTKTEPIKNIKKISSTSIIYKEEIFQKYGNDLDIQTDDTVITNIVKTDIGLQNTDVIYRIRHNKNYQPVKTSLIDKLILIERNLTDNDYVLIDNQGIEQSSIDITGLNDISNLLLSKDKHYLAYTEKDEKNNSTNLLIVDLVNDSTSEIRLKPIIDIKGDLSPLSFSSDTKDIYMKFTSHDPDISPVIYTASLENQDAEPLKLTNDIKDIQGIYAFDDILLIAYKVEDSITIEMIDIKNQNRKIILTLSDNKQINNMKYIDNTLYYNSDSAIFAYNNKKNLLIENATLLDVDPNQQFIIYKKASNFKDTSSVFLFNIQTKTSKEIFKNKQKNYGSINYTKKEYIGILK